MGSGDVYSDELILTLTLIAVDSFDRTDLTTCAQAASKDKHDTQDRREIAVERLTRPKSLTSLPSLYDRISLNTRRMPPTAKQDIAEKCRQFRLHVVSPHSFSWLQWLHSKIPPTLTHSSLHRAAGSAISSRPYRPSRAYGISSSSLSFSWLR